MKVHALRGEHSPFANAMAQTATPLDGSVVVPRSGLMTVSGTVEKTAILLGLAVAAAVGAWQVLDATNGAFVVLVLTGMHAARSRLPRRAVRAILR